MTLPRYVHWHNAVLVLLIAAIAADIAFGLDSLLNAISTIVVVGSVLAIVGAFAAAGGLLLWITIRDLIEDIRSDKRERAAWRWKILAIAGCLGILLDGLFGAWNAYHRHVQFSESVEAIPFSGIPVLLLLASYPVKWAEQYLEGRKKVPGKNTE